MHAYVLEPSAKRPTLVERPRRAPGPGEVRVRTSAVSIHPVDLETADGGNKMLLPHARPFVPGVDFAGVVDAVGDGVDLAEGDVVYGYRGVAGQGAFAEAFVASATEVARAPAGHTPEQLACLPLPALCALQALDEAGLGTPGRVLVHGGAGGVGAIAVQVFARLGHHVTATASARDAEWVADLGARDLVDYRRERFEDVVSDQDLVFDTVGGDTLDRSFGVVRPGGTVVSLRAMPGVEALRGAGMHVPWLLGPVLSLLGWGARRKAHRAEAALVGQVTVPSAARLAVLTELAGDRRLQTRIDRTFPFDALPSAMDHAASGSARGRVVVTL